MSDGITLYCPRCGKYSALKKEYDSFKEIDVYTCQEKECGRKFAIELVISSKSKEKTTSKNHSQNEAKEGINLLEPHESEHLPSSDTHSHLTAPTTDCRTKQVKAEEYQLDSDNSLSGDTSKSRETEGCGKGYNNVGDIWCGDSEGNICKECSQSNENTQKEVSEQ